RRNAANVAAVFKSDRAMGETCPGKWSAFGDCCRFFAELSVAVMRSLLSKQHNQCRQNNYVYGQQCDRRIAEKALEIDDTKQPPKQHENDQRNQRISHKGRNEHSADSEFLEAISHRPTSLIGVAIP